MGWFKRLCLIVFGLVGLCALAALCLPWVGPWTAEARVLIADDTYFNALAGAVGITGAGLLFCLLRALLAPRNRKSVVISALDGGQITVTRTAIASQARHIVERDGTCLASATRVRAKKRGHVRVSVRVTPLHALNVVEKGAELHDELVSGLATICDDKLEEVSLDFTDPQDFEEPGDDYEERYLRPSDAPAAEEARGEDPSSHGRGADPDRSGEIVVPMHAYPAPGDATDATAAAGEDAAGRDLDATDATAADGVDAAERDLDATAEDGAAVPAPADDVAEKDGAPAGGDLEGQGA
ncbi:alkaline shock response membrane anchor protein AmaP [Olsenella sp. YH-ols2223]|uniref:Alkaline shock response membrane anchor protein AmaP n=1 Tax=Olsenella absiana TaxID=3115222 RepID=A0ABU7R7A5_9ACTN